MRPWRSSEGTAQPAVPLPPDRIPRLRAGRPLKWWRRSEQPSDTFTGELPGAGVKQRPRHEARW